uniref:MarR family transcriptional regulator n=2 Tax=Litorilinea aerophila TaxID=1204385 RepID=A0A540VD17_9CHLR
MGFWRSRMDTYENVRQLLEERPGLSAREIARHLDVAPSTVTRMLPNLEEAGILLYEDDKGRLWPFQQED